MNIRDFRLAILHRLVTARRDVGKTELQKLMYFLQEAFDVPTLYSYRMHHYGPFAESIETDLARLQATGFVKVARDDQGYGYHITPSDKPTAGWIKMVEPYAEKIDDVLKVFGERPTHELELAATIHFVKNLSPNSTTKEVLEKVKALKPKFDMSYVTCSHRELIKAGIVPKDD